MKSAIYSYAIEYYFLIKKFVLNSQVTLKILILR